MLKIGADQMAALGHAVRRQRVARLLDRLRSSERLDLLSGREDALHQRALDALEDASALGIETEENLERFVALAFMPGLFADPGRTSATMRILNRIEWDATDRLDFLYRNVVMPYLEGPPDADSSGWSGGPNG
jgi:hypothetical protein